MPAQDFPFDPPEIQVTTRPWGDIRFYAHNQPATANIARIQPGQRLSLQSHAHRSELWVVLTPGAEVQVGDEIFHPEPFTEFWIPANVRHRIGSIAGEVRFLEVAFGDWQQADITRYADDYDRPAIGEG